MFLFNPDNDLALANFSTNYTPPASAIKIAEDLAVLPLWFAPDGSKIVAEGVFNEAFLLRVQEIFPINSTIIPFSKISEWQHPKTIIPWGWNPALRKKLLDAGVEKEKLPSIPQLERLRNYSGRQHAVKMLRELKELRNDFCGESYFFEDLADLTNYLSTEINSVLKMPNSGSGKGLVWIKGAITDKQTDWCRRVIREQGGVIAEPVLDKMQDFAMEFFVENRCALFSGYSLFNSAASGAYTGNYLLSDEGIEKALAEFIPLETLRWLKDFYLKKLPEYFPHYNGYIGVDMMICKPHSGYRVQPCVEMNLRMNMGMAARIFYDRFVHPDSSGNFNVDFFKKLGEALDFQKKMQNDFPLAVENGKMISGFLSLTPISEKTNYVAWVIIEKTRQTVTRSDGF